MRAARRLLVSPERRAKARRSSWIGIASDASEIDVADRGMMSDISDV
jgi:hypothetical protein